MTRHPLRHERPDVHRVWLRTVRSVFAIVAAGLFIVATWTDAAADDPVTWTQFDVTLDVLRDGSFHVTERQEIAFDGGPYRGGEATLPLDHLDDIRNVTVSEVLPNGDIDPYRAVSPGSFNDRVGTYAVTRRNSGIDVAWGFPPATNESRTFLLEYDVIGGLRVYTDPPNEQVWWTAIGPETTEIGPVTAASMTVTLPQPVPLDQVVLGQNDTTIDGFENPAALAAYTDDGQTWRWTATDLTSGDELITRLEFPPIIDVPAPAWQEADDQQRFDEEQRSQRDALLSLMYLGIAFGIAALGGIGLYALWYVQGRDPHVGAVAQFLPEPPDDLPAGAVGVLLDEQADERDIVATVVDLARRGVVTLDETTVPSTSGTRPDFAMTIKQQSTNVAPFEQTLLTALFGPTPEAGAKVSLSEVKARFDAVAPTVKEQLYDEVVRRGYFPTSPATTRGRWKRTGVTMLIVVAVVGLLGGILFSGRLAAFWFAVAVAAVVAFVLVRLSGALPRKSAPGAEAAAKWRAFRTYLDDIDKYEQVEEAKGIFERNLAYAIAFGLAESWVGKFASISTPTPDWFGGSGGLGGPILGDPFPHQRRRRGGMVVLGSPGGWEGGSSGDGGGDLPDMPDLQDMSDRAGRSLQSSSGSLFDMLNDAAKAFGSMSGSGGGSTNWGSRGGGGGGRRSGFGGGGSRGGSSGGGRRGFH